MIKLKERFKTYRPNTTSREFFDFENGLKCVHYGDIYKNYSARIVSSSNIINRFNQPISDSKVFRCDSIIFPDVTETIDDFGHFTYIKYDGEPYINGTHTFAITSNCKDSLMYLFLHLQSETSRKRLQTLLSGSTVFQLSLKLFDDFELLDFSNCKATQQHIVDLIGSLDDKIEVNEKVAEKLLDKALLIIESLYSDKIHNSTVAAIILENPKSKIKVGDASSDSALPYAFFTSGEKTIYHTDYLIDGINIFLNTGGNAGAKIHQGKCAYSTDTWSVESKELTEYLYLVFKSRIKEINDLYFEGSALRHLQKPLLKNMSIYVPNTKEAQELNAALKPMFQKIFTTRIENAKLEQLKKYYLKKFFD